MLKLAVLAASFALTAAPTAAPPDHQYWDTTVHDDHVIISSQLQSSHPPPTPGSSPQAPHASHRAPLPEPIDLGPRDLCSARIWTNGACWVPQSGDDQDPASPVSIEDFVSFAPAPAGAASEPGHFAFRNLSSNFVAHATTHTRSGQLLGQQASAEFTPVAYEWHYGDGTSQVVRTPGATWSALGLPEFDRTATSHIYTEKGSYTVTLVTHYAVRAAYASDDQWWDVPGTLAIASASFPLQVVTVKTVLVDKDCIATPSGPGC